FRGLKYIYPERQCFSKWIVLITMRQPLEINSGAIIKKGLHNRPLPFQYYVGFLRIIYLV
ncbi:MAG: hypothetical protein C0408_07825, partial [Odoribacter sp.]|nr:hypothetical protein [Odoribacter sp.]